MNYKELRETRRAPKHHAETLDRHENQILWLQGKFEKGPNLSPFDEVFVGILLQRKKHIPALESKMV